MNIKFETSNTSLEFISYDDGSVVIQLNDNWNNIDCSMLYGLGKDQVKALRSFFEDI